MIILAAVVTVAAIGWRLYHPPALYRITILPSLGDSTTACSLNDRGQVAGVAHVGNELRLFLWDREHGIQDLGPGMGGRVMINNAGQIAGTMRVDPNYDEGFLWEPGQGTTMLGTLEGKGSIVHGMNNRGQIIGSLLGAQPHSSAFIWEKATGMRRLSGPNGASCFPVYINDTGQVLVYLTNRPPRSPMLYCLVDPNGPVFLDRVARDMEPRNINNRSCMGGIETPTKQTAYLVFLDEQKTLRRLAQTNLGWVTTTRLNDRNQIAYTDDGGSLWRKLEHRLIRLHFGGNIEEPVSYLYDPVRGPVTLNRYVRGVGRFHVVDLNNNGCIVGVAEVTYGSWRTVLLEPIPERWGK